jgi:hypothetical protein
VSEGSERIKCRVTVDETAIEDRDLGFAFLYEGSVQIGDSLHANTFVQEAADAI